jgi:MSHA biogenesis protein MshQ
MRYVMLGAGGFLDFLGDNWYVSNIVLDTDVTPVAAEHFRLSYLSSALTCEPHSVSIQACADAPCSELYTGSSTITLSPSGWSGGDTISFTGGTATASLIKTTPGTVTVGVASSTPASLGGATQCSIGGGAYSTFCNLTYADAGFVVSIPEFISGRGETATIQAVKKSDASTQCVPAFANINKTINLWSEYSLPNSGTLSAYASSPSVALGQTAPFATPITAAFNASGVATVPVNYSDAGYVKVNVNYTGSGADAGLNMAGDATFLARPAGMCVQTGGECTSPSGGNYANCGVFKKAGEVFSLIVSAVAWEADGETDFCDNNAVTPNYTSTGSNVDFSSAVVSPSGGANGRVNIDANSAMTSYLQTSGSQTLSVNQSEVGVFNIGVIPPTYYGASLGKIGDTTPVTFNSQPTGRFIPDHFAVVVDKLGSIKPSCPTENLYTGEVTSWFVAPELLITAFSKHNEVTTNYTHTDYLKLNAASVFAGVVPPTTDSSLTTMGNDGNPLAVDTNIVEGAFSASGTSGVMSYIFSAADDLSYPRGALSEIAPFTPDLDFLIDTTVVDSDGVAVNPAVSFTPDSSGVSVRFGRLWLEDTYGSDTSNLMMELRSEYFDGSGYVVNTFDDCSDWDGVNASIDSLSAVLPGSGTLTDGESGNAGLMLQATSDVPGTPDEGDAIVTYAAPTWLRGDYDGNGSFENPEGRATFGINRGHERLIFRKEVR